MEKEETPESLLLKLLDSPWERERAIAAQDVDEAIEEAFDELVFDTAVESYEAIVIEMDDGEETLKWRI